VRLVGGCSVVSDGWDLRAFEEDGSVWRSLCA